MFRHHSKNRTFIHNLRLAILLSLVAGLVNITGVLALKTLTTNVTGHFAYFADAFMSQEYSVAFTFLAFIFCFLAGSFTSNFLTEWVSKTNPKLTHVLPVTLEILVLISVGIFGSKSDLSLLDGKIIAFCMLFSMGLQNSLVTKISNASVRTTHLTGLFTDLGIELSQLFFQKKQDEIKKLKRSIYLRCCIVLLFFTGCFLGDLLYHYLQLQTLFVASIILIFALVYDYLRLQLIGFSRRKKTK